MMLTFDRLQAGRALGNATVPVDADCLSKWDSMFPGSIAAAGDHLPSGLVVALMMRGYVAILGERPQGNVHVEQEFFWETKVPKESVLVVTLSCLRKEVQGGRRWVWFDNQVGNAAGVRHVRGIMKLVWAA
jgi:hypothetical protein